jgi:hypothetical protein
MINRCQCFGETCCFYLLIGRENLKSRRLGVFEDAFLREILGLKSEEVTRGGESFVMKILLYSCIATAHNEGK